MIGSKSLLTPPKIYIYIKRLPIQPNESTNNNDNNTQLLKDNSVA